MEEKDKKQKMLDSTKEKMEGTLNGWFEKIKAIFSHFWVGLISFGCALLLLIILIQNQSIVSKDRKEIDDLEQEKWALEQKNTALESKIEELESEIEELTNGPSRLLEKVKSYYNDKDWTKTIEIANELHANFNGTAEDTEAQDLKKKAEEEVAKAEQQKKEEEERKKAEEQQRKEEEERKKAEEEARGYETGITYEQLARYPDDYLLKKVKFTGKVIQVMDGSDEVQIRLAVDSNYDQVLLAYYDPSIVNGKVLEDDIITIYGVSWGDYTYKSVMGASITVPLVEVDKIDQ